MSEYSQRNSRGRMGDICDGKSLVDYGKWKRVGAGHRRGGAGRRRQRGSWSASDGGTDTTGGAVRRTREAPYAGKARRGRSKGRSGVSGAPFRATGCARQQYGGSAV